MPTTEPFEPPEAFTTVDALWHSQAILQSLAEGTTDAVFVKDRQGRYVMCNSATCQFVGLPREAVVGRDDTALFEPATARRIMDGDAEVMATGETKTIEETMTIDGVEWTFLATKGPVRIASGQVVGIFGVSRDITERKRMEEALQASEQRYRALIEWTPVPLLVHRNGEVLYANAATQRLLRAASPAELLGTSLIERLTPESRALALERTRDALARGVGATTTPATMRMVDFDGAQHEVEIQSVAVSFDGGPAVFSVLRDITAEKATERTLRASEYFFRETQRAANIGSYHLEFGTGFWQSSEVLDAIFGIDATYVRSVTGWMELIHPDDQAMMARYLEDEVIGGRHAFSKEYRIVRKSDGGVRWVHGLGVLTFDAAGQLATMTGTIQDITERKEAERALQASEEKFRNLFDNSQVGIFRSRLDGSEMLDVNEQFLRIFKRRREEVLGRPAMVHWVDPADREVLMERIRHGHSVSDFEADLLASDGEVRRCVLSVRLYADEGVVEGSIADVTERRNAEDALRKSEERHRAILQSALDGFWVVDAEGRILEVNETYCRMSGYSQEELLSMRLFELEGAESPEEIATRSRSIVEEGAARFESRHRRKDGSTYPVEVSVRHRPVDGGIHVAFIQDITRRRQSEDERAAMQAQLQHAQKMESVGRLAGGVAHDFNNMLGVILGNVDLALEQVAESDPLREDLTEVRRAAVRSVELTRQLLAFARKQTVAPLVLDLNSTVGGMLKMLQRLIGEDITIGWRPQAELWPVKVDPSQVDQILANLCVNARDAISGTGTLTIETANRTFTAAEPRTRADMMPGDYVEMSVRDDGAGMDAETQQHLFEPFYTTKTLGKGTGLGLATVWGIVRQNNGFIEVSSAVGQGTTFRIFLPRHRGKAASASADGVAGAVPRGGETILLVEDEPGLLALAARMLERQGYRVLRAGTPGEAMRLAREYHGDIQLLMTDVVMPEMNGRELAKQVLTLFPGIKRLFMSGYTSDVIAHRGVLDNGVHFVQKPFTMESLTRKVREALDHGRED